MDSSKMEHSYYQKEYSSSKWNTHIIKRNTHHGTLILSKGILIIKMEHSYYQKEHSSWNTQKELILSKGILIIKMEHSYYQKEY